MHNILQQKYISRYATYLHDLQTMQSQIVAIFAHKQLSDNDYRAIQFALMSALARCGLIGDPQNLFEEVISMRQPSKDQLISFIDKTIQTLNTHRDRVVEASNNIVVSKRKKGVHIAPSFL